MFGDPAAERRIRKRAELTALQVASAQTVERLERASAEQRAIAEAVRNTVNALRGGVE